MPFLGAQSKSKDWNLPKLHFSIPFAIDQEILERNNRIVQMLGPP